jgi:hypothetical protein
MEGANYTLSTIFPDMKTPGFGPYLLPPNPPAPGGTLVLSIVGLCTSTTTPTTQGIPPGTNPDFSLVFKQAADKNIGVYAEVTVPPTNVFTDSRFALQASFTSFQQQVEALEVTSKALIPGGARLLLARVASGLPLRIDEVLFYHYGMHPIMQSTQNPDPGATQQYIDLQPGMAVRAEWGGYQYCDAPGGPGNALNSYVGYGASRFMVSQAVNGLLTFDPFVRRLNYTLNPPVTCPLVAGGLLDVVAAFQQSPSTQPPVQAPGNPRRHLRLVYPTQFAGSGTINNAATPPSCVLLGADTFVDLAAATTDVLSPTGTNGCITPTSGNNPITSISFNGRAIFIPEITVLVRGAAMSVPVGTTVRNVMQQFVDPALVQFNNATSELIPQMYRYMQGMVAPFFPSVAPKPNAPYGIANVVFNTLSTLGPAMLQGPYGDQWDLPLLKGDSITWIER